MNRIYSDRKPTSRYVRPEACVGIVQEGAQGIFFMVIKIFCTLTVVVITLVYKFVKNNRNVFFMGAFLLNAKLNKADLPKKYAK